MFRLLGDGVHKDTMGCNLHHVYINKWYALIHTVALLSYGKGHNKGHHNKFFYSKFLF